MFGWQNLCPLDFYLDNLKIKAFGFGKIKDFKTQNQWIANDIKPKEFHKVSHWMATLKKTKIPIIRLDLLGNFSTEFLCNHLIE